MECIFCGKKCVEPEIEGNYKENVCEGRILGNSHICMECLAELKDLLGMEELEKRIAELEYELYEQSKI